MLNISDTIARAVHLRILKHYCKEGHWYLLAVELPEEQISFCSKKCKALTPLLFQRFNMLQKKINPPHIPHLLLRCAGRDSPEIIWMPQIAQTFFNLISTLHCTVFPKWVLVPKSGLQRNSFAHSSALYSFTIPPLRWVPPISTICSSETR